RSPGLSATDGRTSVWDPEGLDGRHPLPNPDARQGPNRDEPSRAGLQSQANDHDLRSGTADGSDQNLIALFKATRPSRSGSALAPWETQCVGPNPFFHGLGQTQQFPTPRVNGRYRIRKLPLRPMIDDADSPPRL